jgi:hypothetical protein
MVPDRFAIWQSYALSASGVSLAMLVELLLVFLLFSLNIPIAEVVEERRE